MHRTTTQISAIKSNLLSQLKEEKAFWSYESQSVDLSTLSDDQLIALTLRYLDIEEIRQLFKIFSFQKVKSAWKRLLIPEGAQLYNLNRFFAWFFFKAKKPDAYVKSLETRHFNRLMDSFNK